MTYEVLQAVYERLGVPPRHADETFSDFRCNEYIQTITPVIRLEWERLSNGR